MQYRRSVIKKEELFNRVQRDGAQFLEDAKAESLCDRKVCAVENGIRARPFHPLGAAPGKHAPPGFGKLGTCISLSALQPLREFKIGKHHSVRLCTKVRRKSGNFARLADFHLEYHKTTAPPNVVFVGRGSTVEDLHPAYCTVNEVEAVTPFEFAPIVVVPAPVVVATPATLGAFAIVATLAEEELK